MQVLKNTEIEDGRQDGEEENLEVNDVVTTITAKHRADSDTRHVNSASPHLDPRWPQVWHAQAPRLGQFR